METPTQKQTISYALRHCELFVNLSRKDIDELAASCELREIEAHAVVACEGEIGTEAYVLISGQIEVFTEFEGREVILARLERLADHVGEQSMRSSTPQARVASFRTLSDSQVIAIPKLAFRRALDINPAFSEHLRNKEERNLTQLSLVERSAMYRVLAMFDQAEGWSESERFAAGETVFAEGDPGDKVYVIRSGQARVTQYDGGRERLLAVLHDGQAFGEQSVLDERTRSATVTAETTLEVLSFHRRRFLEAMGQSPDLHRYIATLRRIYALGGGLTTQFDGHFMDQPAIITVYRLPQDREVIVNHLVERSLYEANEQLADNVVIEEYRYADASRDIERILGVAHRRLVHVHARGPWSELEAIHALLVSGDSIPSDQLAAFPDNGHLVEAPPDASYRQPEAELCHCLGLTRRDLELQIARGSHSLERLVAVSGATSVCGSCTARIATMVASAGVPVALREIIEVLPDVRSFRFAPISTTDRSAEPLHAALPGQHVIVSAERDGHWVHRPYTITSSANCTEWREITVRQEPHGYLSSWLFAHPEEVQLKLSHPKGEFWVDLERPEVIVCLVAGIGMTPALAIARSVAESDGGPHLHVDYSARTEQDFAYRSEFDALDSNYDKITVHYRVTGRGERIRSEDFEELRTQYPNGRFYVCGPPSYETKVREGLLSVGVERSDIHTEVFTPVGHAPIEDQHRRTAIDGIASIATLSLCSVYVLQALMEWRWAWLWDLQQLPNYRVVSGSILLTYVAWQWYFPLLRLRGLMHKAANQYRWHKYIGILAPVILYGHSMRIGFAYLSWLTSMYIANAVIGALDKTLIRDTALREYYAHKWLAAHIVVACILTALSLVHAWVVFAYAGSGS